MERPIDRLARRVENDPYFLAWALRLYAESERMDQTALAAHLGCAADVLTRLRLCRLPMAEASDFRRDVETIANRFGIDPKRLADVVRRARAIHALRSGPETSQGTLMAAREDEGEKTDEEEQP